MTEPLPKRHIITKDPQGRAYRDRLTIRVTPDLTRDLHRWAAERNTSVSDLIRSTMNATYA